MAKTAEMVSKSNLLVSLTWFLVSFNKHCQGEEELAENIFTQEKTFFHSLSERQLNRAFGNSEEPDRGWSDWQVYRPSRPFHRSERVFRSTRRRLVQPLRMQRGSSEGKKAFKKLPDHFKLFAHFSLVNRNCVINWKTANSSKWDQQHVATSPVWMTT